MILFHLTAAVVAALVAAPPVSDLSSAVASVFRPYINAVDLNHGYRFFVPDRATWFVIILNFPMGQSATASFRISTKSAHGCFITATSC